MFYLRAQVDVGQVDVVLLLDGAVAAAAAADAGGAPAPGAGREVQRHRRQI